MGLFFKSEPNKAVAFLIVYALILLVPAFFINLGLYPFILDEATRAIVALEMISNDNYIVPTINGELYYNKPPLFNWILIGFVKLFGSTSEWVFRFPVVISLFLFSLTIYLTQFKQIGRKAAFFSAIAFLTCGRILIYDSMKGLIDITFSWVIYMQFWSIWHFYRKQQYHWLFIFSYLLTSLAFLMKGLPALVFQALSLLSWFVIEKRFLKLLSWQHFAGIMVFALIVGAYFLSYHQYNSLENYFNALFTESTKRTLVENPLLKTVGHFFIFPFEYIYHFLPWTLFVLSLFNLERIKKIISTPFTKFLSVIFLVNIMVYWASPAIYARYLFMFVPLFSGIIFYAYSNSPNEIFAEQYILKPLLFLFTFVLLILLSFIPLIADPAGYANFWLKYGLILLLASVPVFFAIRYRMNLILPLFVILLVSRIAFNFFVLPDRLRTNSDQEQKVAAMVAGEITRGSQVYLLDHARIKYISAFYIMRSNGKPLKRWNSDPEKGKFYIIEKEKSGLYPEHTTLFTFVTEINNLELNLIRFD